MFSYEYTKKMEQDLDMVSSGKEYEWSKICSHCFEEIKILSKEIKDLSKTVSKVEKQSYKINDEYSIMQIKGNIMFTSNFKITKFTLFII